MTAGPDRRRDGAETPARFLRRRGSPLNLTRSGATATSVRVVLPRTRVSDPMVGGRAVVDVLAAQAHTRWHPQLIDVTPLHGVTP